MNLIRLAGRAYNIISAVKGINNLYRVKSELMDGLKTVLNPDMTTIKEPYKLINLSLLMTRLSNTSLKRV
jgi:hypothetical protein